jgi:hypothetical protein
VFQPTVRASRGPRLNTALGLTDMPHEIWHFLADADIRAKPNEEKYRQMQEGVVRNYIASLRKQ